MSFEDLPPLPPLRLPGAPDYAERISAASRRVRAVTRAAFDIPYKTEDYWQKLDIFMPDQAELQNLPVLCFLHGGAWVNGCKEWMGFMAPPIISVPAIFVSASYRHAPAARFPAQLQDCLDLVAWLHANIARFGGDPDNIHLGGHSAGGHLAALTTLRPDLLQERGLPYDVIKACYPVSGVFDLRDGQPHSVQPRRVIESFLAEAEHAAGASPVTRVAGNSTPFYVMWGSQDVPELVPQGRAFVEALAGQPGLVRHQEFTGYNHWHTSECAGDADHPWTRTVQSWLVARPDAREHRRKTAQ